MSRGVTILWDRCAECHGWIFGPSEENSGRRCRCDDEPMEKVAWAFAWVAFAIQCSQPKAMGLGEPQIPIDPKEF